MPYRCQKKLSAEGKWATCFKKCWPKEDAVNLGTGSHIFKAFGNVIF